MKQLYGVKESAHFLGISEWTLRGLCKNQKLLPTRIGRRLLVSETELQRFIDECQAKPLPEAQQEVKE